MELFCLVCFISLWSSTRSLGIMSRSPSWEFLMSLRLSHRHQCEKDRRKVPRQGHRYPTTGLYIHLIILLWVYKMSWSVISKEVFTGLKFDTCVTIFVAGFKSFCWKGTCWAWRQFIRGKFLPLPFFFIWFVKEDSGFGFFSLTWYFFVSLWWQSQLARLSIHCGPIIAVHWPAYVLEA